MKTTQGTAQFGKHMQHALNFVRKYPGWHTFNARNRATRDAIARLTKAGFVECNEFTQFRAKL